MKRWGAVSATMFAVLAFLLPASAAAFVVHWWDHDVNEFAGLSCRDTSQVTVATRRGAFAVSVVRPKVGDKLTARGTGRIVATLSSIRRTARGLVFVATGSDDVCAHPSRYEDTGWETVDVHFDLSYQTREHPLYAAECRAASYRPHRVEITCPGRGFYVDRIHWSSWGDRSAAGVGTAHVRSRAYPGVAISLGQVRYCAANGDFEFTHLDYRYTGRHPAGARQRGSGRSGCAKG